MSAGSFGFARERTTPAELGEKGAGSAFSLYTLAGTVSYALDFFGGERRAVEALNAQTDYQRSAAQAARLVLAGNIVNAAIARAGYAEEVAILRNLIELDGAQKTELQAQRQAGYGALSLVLEAEQQLAADRQTLATAKERQGASTTLLKTLLGVETGAADPAMPELQDFLVPQEAPASLPSQLVRVRPDILEAEAALHLASANVGVATAALFPSVSISGDGGGVGSSLANLTGPQGRFWSLGPTIDIPIFRGGSLWSSRRAALAAFARAQSDYRATVLSALEQVADQLEAVDADARSAEASRNAVDAASLNSALGEVNLKAGGIAGYDETTLKIQTGRALLELMAVRAQRLQDVVGLYVASGGGWRPLGGAQGAPVSSPK